MSKSDQDYDSKSLDEKFGPFGGSDLVVQSVVNVAGATRPEGEVASYRTDVLAPINGSEAKPTCNPVYFADVFGSARTGSDGTFSQKLSGFYCPQKERKFVDPAFITATAKTGACVIMTINAVIVGNGDDVVIKAESWSPDGTPVGNKTFNWVCRVATQNDAIID